MRRPVQKISENGTSTRTEGTFLFYAHRQLLIIIFFFVASMNIDVFILRQFCVQVTDQKGWYIEYVYTFFVV